MGSRNRFNPCLPCCSNPSCTLDPGWECNVKNGIVSADVTGWSVDAGTWDATQSWEAGVVADTLTTSSANARISCDTAQSGPLDGRIRVTHRAKITNAADEVVILLNTIKIVLKETTVTISGGGATTTGTPHGIGLNRIAVIRICSWYDSVTGLEYVGVGFSENALQWRTLISEAVLVANGTTEFGCGAVTGAVSFHHDQNYGRDGIFRHNTTKTDATNCKECTHAECIYCSGNDMPRYLTIAVSGLTNPSYGDCSDCTNLNASDVLDMGTGLWCNYSRNIAVYFCYDRTLSTEMTAYDYYAYTELSITEDMTNTDWFLDVIFHIYRKASDGTGSVLPQGDVTYRKVLTAADLCTNIAHTLAFLNSTYGGYSCVGWESLTVIVTASE